MKKLVLSFALVLMSVTAFAQAAYEKTMSEKVAKIAACKTPEDFTALANDFARIGTKETKQWLPNYYAALATIQKGRILMKNGKAADLDPVADEAQKYLDAANLLSKDNAETLILSKMIHSMRMMVNPQQRYMTEGSLATEALAAAEKLDPTNPRITLLKAEDTYFTPEQFGGSEEKGLELFKQSLLQFKSYEPKSAIAPNWGQSEAEYFLSAQNKVELAK